MMKKRWIYSLFTGIIVIALICLGWLLLRSFNNNKAKVAGGFVNVIIDNSNRIIAGTIKGQWITRDKIAPYLKQGETFHLYSQYSFLDKLKSKKIYKEKYISGEEGYYVQLSDENNEFLLEHCFGITGKWNPLPRIPDFEDTNLKEYEQIITDLLQKNNLKEAKAVCKEIIKVDFEGDGSREALIVASNISDKDVEDIINGNLKYNDKYSIVLLQKVREGVAENIIIAENYKNFVLSSIAFVADLNGNGQLEVVVEHHHLKPAEAEGVTLLTQELYEIEDNKPVKILSVLSNPI